MGVNFYWLDDKDERKLVLGKKEELVRADICDLRQVVHDLITELDAYEVKTHVGKRIRGGRYCYDCNATLRKGGAQLLTHCPCCKKKVDTYFSKFVFCTPPDETKNRCHQSLDVACIKDENDDIYTGKEFLDILDKSIEFADLVNKEFS